ncbi:MAG: LysE family translocator [Acidimicrobiales bacterium]
MPAVWAFVAVAIVIVVTPGVDMALVARNTMAGGRRAGLVTALGVCSGLLVHAVLSLAGVSAAIASSDLLFDMIRVVGAGYLIVLGGQSILRAAKGVASGDAPIAATTRAPFAQGFVTNVLNPKLIVFFLALVPQFVVRGSSTPAGLQLAILFGVFIVLGLLWLTAYVLALDTLAPWLRRPRVERSVDAVAGAALIGVGLRLVARN